MRNLLAALLISCAVGCSDDCVRVLKTRVQYDGARAGTFYTREFFPVDGTSTTGTSAVNPQPDNPGATSEACFEEAGTPDEPGRALEGWLDTDGDDHEPCVVNRGLLDRTRCGPDPGEPYGILPFVLKPRGETTVSLVVKDP